MKMSTTNQCNICYEDIKSINNCVTPCGHSFCFGCISKCLSINNTCPCCRTEIAEKIEKDDDSDDDYSEFDEDDDEDSDDEYGDEPLPILDAFTKKLTDAGYTMKDMVKYIALDFGQKIKSETDNQETEEEFEERIGKMDDIYETTLREYKEEEKKTLREYMEDEQNTIREYTEYEENRKKKYVTLNEEEYKYFHDNHFFRASGFSLNLVFGQEVNGEIVNSVYGVLVTEEDYQKVIERRQKELLEEIENLCTMLKKRPKPEESEVRLRAGYKFYPELKRFVSTFTVDEKYYDRLLAI